MQILWYHRHGPIVESYSISYLWYHMWYPTPPPLFHHLPPWQPQAWGLPKASSIHDGLHCSWEVCFAEPGVLAGVGRRLLGPPDIHCIIIIQAPQARRVHGWPGRSEPLQGRRVADETLPRRYQGDLLFNTSILCVCLLGAIRHASGMEARCFASAFSSNNGMS